MKEWLKNLFKEWTSKIDWNALVEKLKEWIKKTGVEKFMLWVTPRLGRFGGFFTPIINWFANLFASFAVKKMDHAVYKIIKEADNTADAEAYGEASDKFKNLPPTATQAEKDEALQNVKDEFDHLMDATGKP